MDSLVEKVGMLCRGRPRDIRPAMEKEGDWLLFCFFVIVTGTGLYGATIGLGRAPLQALYTAVKFPLLIVLTTAGNALLIGMVAQLLGLGISFRQSALAVTTSFAVAAAVLGSLSPVTFYLWLNTPSFASEQALTAHNFTLVTHVAVIAFAGVTGNVSLFRLLADLGGSRVTAGRILAAWLAGNMFLGCQLSWIMRPFIGSPRLPVEFFRAEAFQGTFYESVFRALLNLAGQQ
jgi:hypothetical protein